jgi:hypothetical protein
MLSSEIKLSNVVVDFDCFKKVFAISSVSSEVEGFLEQSSFQTKVTKRISNLKWDSRNEELIFASNTSLLSEKNIK